MNAALLTCKKNAQLLVKSNKPPLAENRTLIIGPKVKEKMKEMTNDSTGGSCRLDGRTARSFGEDVLLGCDIERTLLPITSLG